MKEQHNPSTREYKLGTAVASTLRERNNQALGDLLTMVEFAFGDSEPKKCETMKQLVKQCIWKLTDDNQHTVYYAFEQESRQIGDSNYIERVLNGTDMGEERNTLPE